MLMSSRVGKATDGSHRYGSLRLKLNLHELRQHSGAGRALSFFHDVLHMHLDGGLGNAECTRYFFVGPSFR
jgi:hypothetical protein